MDKRVTELEILYTHQKALLDELSDVLFAQQRTIDDLERRVRELELRPAEEGAPAAGLGADKPPHY